MSASPPEPPPHKKHTAKKANYQPDPYNVNGYQKYENGQYWFHNISNTQWKENPEAWKRLIKKTIIDYLVCLIMSEKKTKARTDEYEIYCKTANAYINSH